MQSDEDIDAFRELLETAQNIVFFTGAGISTESGIPDFRSPGTGLWNKIKPIEFQDFMASDEQRVEYWRRHFSGDRKMQNAKPNKGHEAVARLVAAVGLGAGAGYLTWLLARRGLLPDQLRGIARPSSCSPSPSSTTQALRLMPDRRIFPEAGRVALFLGKWLTVAFFLEALGIGDRPLVREQAVFHAAQEHQWKLKTFG